ncbi:MAG: TRAP transporter small permease subunit [Aquabacterium sp.]|nr:TRAP transporter small permease subunit [Aquabacterium sp.]
MNVLALSRLIDRLNEAVGRWVAWLVLAAVLVSAGNAVVRKLFDTSSNAYLEVQWYLFSAVFLLAAGHTLLRQEHVRIDVLSARLSARSRAWIDVFGIVCFLLPLVVVVINLSWPLVTRAYLSGEMSSNAGGLIRWPVLALLPLGFGLLGAQGVSELIKRLAFLRGWLPEPAVTESTSEAGPS